MEENSSTKKVKLTLVGKSGKMGKAISELVSHDPDLEIAPDGEVVLDFSHPEGTKKALKMNLPLVCGTTGLTKEIFNQMELLSKKVPVLYSPNFSLGIALLFEILETHKNLLKKYAMIEIDETHHKSKLDSPSGTAIKIADLLETDKIHSERNDLTTWIHRINFLLSKEHLTITHEAKDRRVFAQGALVAARFIFNKPPGLYTLRECLLA